MPNSLPPSPRRKPLLIAPAWARLVGPQLAAVSTPAALADDGQLTVFVATEAWADELREMSERIVQRIGEAFPMFAGPHCNQVTSIAWIVTAAGILGVDGSEELPQPTIRAAAAPDEAPLGTESKMLAFRRRVR